MKDDVLSAGLYQDPLILAGFPQQVSFAGVYGYQYGYQRFFGECTCSYNIACAEKDNGKQ